MRYILRRILIAIPLLLGITFISYAIINMAPGDPVDMLMNPAAIVSAEDLAARKKALGLDKPMPVRYVIWLNEMAHGNMGYSYLTRRPVSSLISERIGPTVQLMGIALLVSITVSIPLGVLSAIKQYSLGDFLGTILAFWAISIPSFFLALGLIYLLSLKLGMLPTAGMATMGAPFSLTDRLLHLVLPVTVLGFSEAASLMRYTRSSMLEVIRQDYITTARGKGLRERGVVYGHALRNALLPIITLLGLSIPRLFGGAVIVEQVLQWPGIGTLTIQAVLARDYPLLMGINFIAATLVLLGNLLADIGYALADPRIRCE